jgi:hypothetical protein
LTPLQFQKMKLFSWLGETPKRNTENPKVEQLTSKEKFNLIISDTVKPFLKANGFNKKALTFYKNSDSLIFVINFQNSRYNNSRLNTFYINCGIYSKNVDISTSKRELIEPKVHDCHYRVRISEITKNKIDEYKISDTSDLEIIQTQLVNDLELTIKLFAQINSTADLTNLIITKDCYNNKLFIYFILMNDKASLQEQLHRLRSDEVWGNERRWSKIKDNLDQLLRQYNQQSTVDQILEEK